MAIGHTRVMGGVRTAFESAKPQPEVDDLLVGIPQTTWRQIDSIEVMPGKRGTLYRLVTRKYGGEEPGAPRELVVPATHLDWVGDHWLLFDSPYRIQIDGALRMDWFITEPVTQTTTTCVASTAEAAVSSYRETHEVAEGTVFVGQLHAVSAKADGEKFLGSLLQDLVKRQHPQSPFYGLDFSEGASAQLRTQVAWLNQSKMGDFAKAVEVAFDELTCGAGFWWMMEGPSVPHCIKCSSLLYDCSCDGLE